jgi:hypothetical protein
MSKTRLEFYVSEAWKRAPIGNKVNWLIERSNEQRTIRNNENNKNKQPSEDSGRD